MTRRGIKVMCGVVLISSLLALPVLSSCAQPTPTPTPISAADFYAKETVTLVVSYGAGGGTDYAARLFSSYWPEVAGGTMVVKNAPGGGGLKGVNYVYSAEPDGLTIGLTERGSALLAPTLFETPGVEFDIHKYNWIGFVSADPLVLSLGVDSPYESIEDLQKAEGLKFATMGPRDLFSLGAALIAEIFDLDAKLVPGYGGSAEMALAVGRGEVDGYASPAAVNIGAIDKGLVKPPILVLDYARTEWFPDAPALSELVELSPEQKRFLNVIVSLMSCKVFFGPPGMPEDRVQFVRDAFDQIVVNESFLRQMKLRWKVWVEPVTGEEAAATMEKLMATPKEDIDRFDQVVQKYIK